ncbi:hypothetical protein BJ875DRAFT_61858 [Amylocarpus encephaloides]|uniref:Uncharacterized protein n=1 Tax=Amylocarpus encephaloides TaxID=45428 RepID=A0A9P8C491_9HELO|nr:hypothetical protein BJ875DRAFT_61858 [Amylocarpus encephaloides]
MEPYRKRQRLYAPEFGGHRTPQTYYDSLEPDELADYDREVVPPYRGQRTHRIEPPGLSPLQLQRRKHEIDNKFKSALETIMDKYARDFTGMDDEIDFGTDQVYMTGHLAKVQYEGDVGDRRHEYETSSEEEAIIGALESGSEDATEENEEGSDTEDERSDDDIEDDFLLRGLTTAARRLQPNVGLYARDGLLSSRSQIPAQYEPPHRSQIMPQPSFHEHEHVEPAWRFPEILAPYRNDSQIESAWRMDEQPNAYSRQYPEPYTSARAAPVPPLRFRPPSPNPRASLWDPLQGKKRTRIEHTSEDDECLLDCIRKATVRGTKVDDAFFGGSAAPYPRHPVQSLRKRYEKIHAYQAPGSLEEVEQASEPASEPALFSSHAQLPLSQETRPDLLQQSFPRARQLHSNISARSYNASLTTAYERPARIRKAPRRDSGLVSWEKALNKVKSSDPFLHAGFRRDAMEKPNHEGSWYLNQPSHSQIHQGKPQVFDEIGTTVRAGFPNEDGRHIPRQPRRSPSDGDDSHFGHDATEVPLESSHLHTTKNARGAEIRSPCPHVSCKNNPSTLYQVHRSIEQEQSEMATHLMQAHRTTSYPCAEENCEHKGENGFLMDSDLVNHVRSAHPTGGAVHRLRGRVDPNLLANKKHDSLGSSPNHFNYDTSYNMSVIEASPVVRGFRGPSSSPHISSGSDLDLTSTSRGIFGASTCTPLTNVSSLVVNHPSATKALDSTSPETNYRSSSVVEKQAPRNRVESPILGLPSPENRNSISSTAGILGSDVSCMIYAEGVPISPRIFHPRMGHSMASSIPDSQSSVDDVVPHASEKTRKPQLSPRGLSPRTPKKGNAGIITASYSSKPKVPVSSPTPSHHKTNSNIAAPLIATSFEKRSSKRMVAPGPLNYDEHDELTMDLDGFVLLSSRARTVMPSLEFSDRLKREETSEVTVLSSVEKAPSRKRKLELFQGSDEIDELADEPSTCVSMLGPSARKISHVKTEDSQNTTVISPVDLMKRKYKKLRERQTKPMATPARPSTTHHRALVHRMFTPLLDLDPTRRPAERRIFEIADSAAEGASQTEPSSKNANRRSLSVELLTPSKPTKDPAIKQEGPTIVVKTPKGTLRRCGENGFACRKSFCFRCGIGY